MLTFKLKELIKAYGHQSPGLWLIKTCGIPPHKAYRLIKATKKTFPLDDISLICKKLNCLPNEMLYWLQSPSHPLPEDHRCITELSPPPKENDWAKDLKNLTPEELAEVKEFVRQKANNK